MKKLFLHVGTGKTGSTSIQQTLRKLKIANLYFRTDSKGKKSIPDPNKFAAELEEHSCDTALYSNEWLYCADQSFVESISTQLKSKFDTKIVVYLRRQDKFAVSKYQQRSKNKARKSHSGAVALPMKWDFQADYHSRLQPWIKYFGKENMRVRIFDSNTLDNGDVVVDFFNLLNLSCKPDEIVHSNLSTGLEKTKMGHLLKISGLYESNPLLANQIYQSANNDGKLQPSRTDAREYYEQYREGNIKLNQELGITTEIPSLFSEDFSSYPEERTDLWNEDTANNAILSVFEVLKNFRPRDRTLKSMFRRLFES